MESSKSYTIRTETGEIRLMSQEEVGNLVRSTMEKARAMAPSSPLSPKSPVNKPISPISPYTATSQRLSRSPRAGKKLQLRLSPRNGRPYFDTSSSPVSAGKTPKITTDKDRAETTPRRGRSTEERFTAMVTEKNFTVHTEVAGKKNLSETEINDLVRNSIRRARENAKNKTPQQLETSFQNAVMLNEVTSSPPKRFSWSSPDGSVDDDSIEDCDKRPVNKARKQENHQHQVHQHQVHDPCEISSIDGKQSLQKQLERAEKLKLFERQQESPLEANKVTDDSKNGVPCVPIQDETTPVHANISDLCSPKSAGSANKSFRSFFNDDEPSSKKSTNASGKHKTLSVHVGTTATTLASERIVPERRDEVPRIHVETDVDTRQLCPTEHTAGMQLQTIPESPQTFIPTEQGFFDVASDTPVQEHEQPLTPQPSDTSLEYSSPRFFGSVSPEEKVSVFEKQTDVPITKQSTDSSSSCRSEVSRKSRLEVVMTSEDVEDMKKYIGDGKVAGATRLAYSPGRESGEEEDVCEMADIVHDTMLRARQTAEAAQSSVPASDHHISQSPTTGQIDCTKDMACAVRGSGSLNSEETTIVSNTFRDRLSAPDLQNDRVKRTALSMPVMIEDTEDESDSDRSVEQPLLSSRQEAALSEAATSRRSEASFSEPARSAMAFFSSTGEARAKPKITPVVKKDPDDPSKEKPETDAPSKEKVAEELLAPGEEGVTKRLDAPERTTAEEPKDGEGTPAENPGHESSSFDDRQSAGTSTAGASAGTSGAVTTRSGRASRPLLSLKLTESSEDESPTASKVRDVFSTPWKSEIPAGCEHSLSGESDDRHGVGSTSRRFRTRSTRKQRKRQVDSTPTLSIDTDTVITAELIAGLSSRKGETITAEELNRLILESSNRAPLSLMDDPANSLLQRSQAADQERYSKNDKDGEIVMAFPVFCMDFFELFRLFDFLKSPEEEENEDFHSTLGMETPIEESDEFEPLLEVAEETTTCDTDNDLVGANPRMTFSFSVAEETSSSSSSSSSEDDSSNVGW